MFVFFCGDKRRDGTDYDGKDSGDVEEVMHYLVDIMIRYYEYYYCVG